MLPPEQLHPAGTSTWHLLILAYWQDPLIKHLQDNITKATKKTPQGHYVTWEGFFMYWFFIWEELHVNRGQCDSYIFLLIMVSRIVYSF